MVGVPWPVDVRAARASKAPRSRFLQPPCKHAGGGVRQICRSSKGVLIKFNVCNVCHVIFETPHSSERCIFMYVHHGTWYARQPQSSSTAGVEERYSVQPSEVRHGKEVCRASRAWSSPGWWIKRAELQSVDIDLPVGKFILVIYQ